MAEPKTSPADLKRYRANLRAEIDGALVYEALANAEKDGRLAKVYGRLAAVERKHAAVWAEKLKAAGADPEGMTASPRAKLLAFLGARFGPGFVLPSVVAAEVRNSGDYDSQPDAVAAGMPADERSHARLIQVASNSTGGLGGASVARLEGRHRGAGGNALRAAVLGANDGLVSNLSLVMGVAGAAVSERNILLTGLAGLVAGACSMAMGEWLSVNSSRELYQKQIAAEAEELEQSPLEEMEELALIYQAKGLPEAQARTLAGQLLNHPETALDTLVREELGIDPKDLGGSAWEAAGSSFILFSIGAIFPVAPFLFLKDQTAIVASVAVSGLALAAIGAGTSLFTGRGVAFSARRQLLIGLAAAAVTYGAGALVGATLT
ncbi:MAG: VIT1/CCC1 transporter family protein [Caulobacteraceae bacterium]